MILALVLCFASCEGGIKGDEAKATINEFFAALASEDYEKAESLLHPDRPADLEDFIKHVESRKSLDFSEGITIEKYTGISSSYYNSAVDGSTYGLDMKVKIGDTTARISIELVKNEYGYGIYNFEINL